MIDIKNFDIIPLYRESDGCSFHRILLPFLCTDIDFENLPFATREEGYARCKIVTFNREPGITLTEMVNLRKRYGFKIVMDLDDWLIIPPTHSLYNSWNKNNIPEIYKNVLPYMDAVTVTTQKLKDKILFEKWHDNIFVIPNAMPFIESQYEQVNQFLFKDYHEGEETRFIWAGGSTHYRDIKNTLSGVFRAFPTLNFSMAGYNDTVASSKAHWDKMERLCSNNLHNPRYERIHTKPLRSYATSFDYQDVALAPLDINEPWNGFKSSLKAYEAGVKKMACIASDMSPYADDHAEGVTLCKNSKEWQAAIEAHKDLGYAREQGKLLYRWVKANRNLEHVNKWRFQVYDYISRGGHANDAPTMEQYLNLKTSQHEPETVLSTISS